eukprot:m.78340 g.78340  ORF g.78340 m.78340 type:complete len:261 (-) comp11951_c1_seq1:149-931(-)
MFMTRSEYDRGVNTFSPEGRIFQVEYANEAIKIGSTAIGIQAKDGVVIAVERRISSSLMEANSVPKVFEVDAHIACAMSGLTADARTLIERARVEAQNYWFSYNEPMSVESVTQAVCNLAMQFGEGSDAESGSMSRPFGVALLFAGVDKVGDKHVASLYHADPSGTFVKYSAKAIGSGSEGAQTALQDGYDSTITIAQAQTLALETLKQVMEEKMTPNNIEVVVVTGENGLKRYTDSELEGIIEGLSAGINDGIDDDDEE